MPKKGFINISITKLILILVLVYLVAIFVLTFMKQYKNNVTYKIDSSQISNFEEFMNKEKDYEKSIPTIFISDLEKIKQNEKNKKAGKSGKSRKLSRSSASTHNRFNHTLTKSPLTIDDHIKLDGISKNIIISEKYEKVDNLRKGDSFEEHQNMCFEQNCKNCKEGTCYMYGPTNYPNPNEMTPVELSVFKNNYPKNMTLQDYVNWLWLHKNSQDELSYDHLRNLNKLLRGIKLKYEYGFVPPPSKQSPPLNAEDYFAKLYNKEGRINLEAPLNSTTGALLGYNYGDYSNFNANFDQLGTSGHIASPEMQGIKKDAREVEDRVGFTLINNAPITIPKESDETRLSLENRNKQ